MTGVTDVQSASAGLRVHKRRPLVRVITTLYYVAIIFHRRLWYCAFFCAMCVFEVRGSS